MISLEESSVDFYSSMSNMKVMTKTFHIYIVFLFGFMKDVTELLRKNELDAKDTHDA